MTEQSVFYLGRRERKWQDYCCNDNRFLTAEKRNATKSCRQLYRVTPCVVAQISPVWMNTIFLVSNFNVLTQFQKGSSFSFSQFITFYIHHVFAYFSVWGKHLVLTQSNKINKIPFQAQEIRPTPQMGRGWHIEMFKSNPTAGMSRIGFFIQGRNSNGFPWLRMFLHQTRSPRGLFVDVCYCCKMNKV